MRKVFLVIIGLLAVAYIVYSFAELENILVALSQSEPLYLGAAFTAQALLLLTTSATFWWLYRLVGLQESGKNLFLMTTAAIFVNLLAPSSGIGGLAVFLDEARRRGLSTGRVMVAGVLYVLYDYIALFAALAAGFIVLERLGKLNAAELTAAGFIVVLAVGVTIGLVVGYRSTRQLGNILAWLARGVNRLLRPLLHRDWMSVAAAHTFSAEMTDGLSSLRTTKPGQILLPLAFTLVNKLLLILILALAFLALGSPVSAETVVAGFSIGHLFVYASPTPSGIGFVDSILPVGLSSLGVPFHQAVLVALVFRAVTLWLPLILGALAFRALQQSQMERPRRYQPTRNWLSRRKGD